MHARPRPCPWIVFTAEPVRPVDSPPTYRVPPVTMRCTRCGRSEMLTARDWPPGNPEQERECYDKVRPHLSCID